MVHELVRYMKGAVPLCKLLSLQFDPVVQVSCALYLCSRKMQLSLFLFSKAGKRFLRSRQVFVSRLFTLSFSLAGRTVGTVFHLQRL